MSLYFPYLHWDTYRRMIMRRTVLKERIARGRSRPTPKKVGKLDIDLQVAWRYLSYDPPFNTRRTLDQFGYPNLLDSRARDDDQMLYKRTKVDNFKKEVKAKDYVIAQQQDNREMGFGEEEDDFVEDIDEDNDDVADKMVKYEDLKDGKVLMIDQVWLWIFDNCTLRYRGYADILTCVQLLQSHSSPR
jgi:hypothetical protein